MNNEFLKYFIVTLAVVPFIIIGQLYFYLKRDAGFKNPKQAKLQFVRAGYTHLIGMVLIIVIIFDLFNYFLLYLILYVIMMVAWYLTERHINQQKEKTD
ncbi:MAG: hypothetical protein V1838_05485 [Patescibacteria group bacterium]